jgi:Xaa-Pro aminopeptidase
MPEATPAISSRLARLRERFAGLGIEALIVSQPDNRRYLSGFTGSTGWLVITGSLALLVTDSRYWEQVEAECLGYELIRLTVGFSEDGLPAALARAGALRIGFEADAATYAEVTAWQATCNDCTWVPTSGVIGELRAVKDDAEIALLRRAIRLADDALAAALEQVRPGMTERELAWIIETYVRTHGAQGMSFETIVAGGPNGSRPHARASDAPLLAGVPIVIDMGARLDGYCSDLTRTICLGDPQDADRFWNVYNTVLAAQQAAEAFARPGLTGAEVDLVARDYIRSAGYGEYFGHGLGHGVGLAIHEAPRFSRLYTAPLVEGNVVTVEPGIYLPGWGGVRIEDIVLLTSNGAEILTAAPKDPVVALR